MRLFLILASISLKLFSPSVPQTGNSKIVFSSNREGSYQIYVMNGDGSGVVRLTNSNANDDLPRWSPNGTKILFQSDRDHPDTGYIDIYVMNADGSGVTRLTTDVNDDSRGTWSPDGNQNRVSKHAQWNELSGLFDERGRFKSNEPVEQLFA